MEETIPTSHLTLSLDSDQAYIAGRAGADLRSQGIDIYINKKIEAKTKYLFESRVVGGNYNPKKFENSSWGSRVEGGWVEIEEVDLDKKTAKGKFEFTATSGDEIQNAKVRGTFNLRPDQ
ncbi:hypothetical protein [Pseudomonas mandelii]|uniref:hypothetical protein n=1 Tax=Pseudomonas mandelii TaxID=75612 RepID=UPI0020A10792|nr:hypothetical protein [Pseudomonas mandelii]MCO8312253.1 hypothetical protein [Pseudomonas mandelii]